MGRARRCPPVIVMFFQTPFSPARRVALLGLFAMAASACGVSPSLPPLPPPDEPYRFSLVREGVVLVEGTLPVDDAKVFILNHHTEKIFGQFVHEPKYAFEVEAEPGHFLTLWYTAQAETSDGTGFELADLTSENTPADSGLTPADAEPKPTDGGP